MPSWERIGGRLPAPVSAHGWLVLDTGRSILSLDKVEGPALICPAPFLASQVKPGVGGSQGVPGGFWLERVEWGRGDGSKEEV